jgi:hypothetical protein
MEEEWVIRRRKEREEERRCPVLIFINKKMR